MPDKHSVLGASSAHRWLNCPPSARLTQHMHGKDSQAASEGTLAHAWCEYELRKMIGQTQAEKPTDEADEQMREAVDAYTSFITESLKGLDDYEVLIEQMVEYENYAPTGFGTADCLILSPGHLHVVDFKYGQGVKVSATDNPQMKLYALAAVEQFGDIYDFDSVDLSIVQPRLGNVSTFSTTVEELQTWGEQTVKPTALLAFEGKGEYQAGDWCRWCKAAARCRARAEENLALAKREFAPSALLSDEELSEVLLKGRALEKWVKDVEREALEHSISTGKTLPGFKIVEGRSARQWSNAQDVEAAAAGADLDIFEKKMLSVSQVQKLLGKKRFDLVFSAFVEKPQGKPALVPDSDPRPPMNFTSAAQDFTN